MTYLLLAAAVVLTTAGQALQKVAVDRNGRNGTARVLSLQLALEPTLWIALLCLVIGMVAWLMVLYRVDVSKALPFFALGQVLVLFVARISFGEHIPVRRWLGAGLIVIGIGLIAQT